jgi:catechol 2,3-dioxygenase-like lactoylglutathione lyase family enzyme
MSQLGRPNLHHVAITVRDFTVSIPWYEQLFQIAMQVEAPHEGGTGKLLADEAWSLILVLHEHDVNDGREFSERATGLDHIGFGVRDRAELVSYQERLEALGVRRVDVADRPLTQSPIADTPYGGVLVFRDPDNIQLEFFSPPGT